MIVSLKIQKIVKEDLPALQKRENQLKYVVYSYQYFKI